MCGVAAVVLGVAATAGAYSTRRSQIDGKKAVREQNAVLDEVKKKEESNINSSEQSQVQAEKRRKQKQQALLSNKNETGAGLLGGTADTKTTYLLGT